MSSLEKKITAWLMVFRLRTLPIPTIQVCVGLGLAFAVTGAINWLMAFFTFLVACFITLGTNIINDVIDFERGDDPLNRLGYRKALSAGLLTKSEVHFGGILMYSLAIASSIPLAIYAGWILFFIVILSTIIGYCYTGGPYPICYNGLSELFILLFYGGVCVISSFYIQTGLINKEVLLCSLQMGFLAILPNAVNNFRDINEDAAVNKRTLAVKFGNTFARWEITAITVIAFLLGVVWLLLGYMKAALMPLVLIPLAFVFLKKIWENDPSPLFNNFFIYCILLHFLFGLLLILGFLL